jgi:hypothetical protein
VPARLSEFRIQQLSHEARAAGEAFACEADQERIARPSLNGWFFTAAAATAAVVILGFGFL